MIAEMLEWCATPCPWFARRRGLLAAQIAIRHRARRCREAWKPHLDSCRKFVAEVLEEDSARGRLVVLGSGHLNDFDLPGLLARYERITLVDAVHPLEIQIRARFSGGRLRTVAADLLNPSDSLKVLVAGADWVISSCLLSQLPVFARESDSGESVVRHLEWMERAPRWVLITDVAKRPIGAEGWVWLMETGPLPQPEDEWIWTIAPPGECGPVGEERLVWAFSRSSVAWKECGDLGMAMGGGMG
jgi:hypothetical protein